MSASRSNIQLSSTDLPLLAGLRFFLGRLINRWIAGMIARSEREATRAALRYLDDRQLKDIGIYRGQIDDAFAASGRQRLRSQQRANS